MRKSITIHLKSLLLICPFCFSSQTSHSQEVIRKEASNSKAILIWPGLGDKKSSRKKQEAFFYQKGYDVFIPDFQSRKAWYETLAKFNDFMVREQLGNYDSILVFSYILGSLLINDYIKNHPQTHIKSILNDRSPIHELAPLCTKGGLGSLQRFYPFSL
ncbi:MAG: hypothetical protein MRZ79_16860 [Bacteroidia bacterium]|nr:hypothetical protein [Bacteroidia bacterium]